jgi:glycosyltransferase involved in cell wall biosynthesis
MIAASPASVVAAWRQVATTPELAEFLPHAATIAQLLRRNQSFDEAREVAASALDLTLDDDVRERTALELATASISAGEPAPADLGDRVRAVLRQADAALDAGSLEVAADQVLAVVEAVFNRELHADVLDSPLAGDPEGFLAPLRESKVFGVLGASKTPHEQPRGKTARLLIVPGDYPNFTKPIIDEFSEQPGVEVRVLDLKSKESPPRRRGQRDLILDRLRDATGAAVPAPSAADEALLEWADTIFVDWCDNAALWTTIHAPRKARIVVRFHSLEAISHQVHLIDWSRVSDAVFVADHVRALVSRAAPAVANGPRIHVAPNAMHLARFGKPKLAGADRTIAIVGWAQRVKDPLWALDVLARLRAVDDSWTLLLVGRDFQERAHLSAMRHRDKFRARAQEDDVRDGIRYLPFTDDVPSALQAAGFVLSASRREGFPVGTTEGAASGAVPVVRNWPMYARYGGARGTFPPDWVVDDADAAVSRILAHADPELRSKEGAAARSYVVEHFDWSVVLPTYRDILL